MTYQNAYLLFLILKSIIQQGYIITGVVVRTLGVVSKVGEKSVAPRVGEKRAYEVIPLHAPVPTWEHSKFSISFIPTICTNTLITLSCT